MNLAQIFMGGEFDKSGMSRTIVAAKPKVDIVDIRERFVVLPADMALPYLQMCSMRNWQYRISRVIRFMRLGAPCAGFVAMSPCWTAIKVLLFPYPIYIAILHIPFSPAYVIRPCATVPFMAMQEVF